MTSTELYEVLGDINEKHVKETIEYRKTKKPIWLKWGSMAVCLCLVIGLATVIPSLLKEKVPEQHSTGAHLQFISTEIVEWENNGFKGVVVCTGNSRLFPVGAKLTVIFREQNTEIILKDGTSYGYGEIKIDDIGWSAGSIIDIGFGVYEEYAEEKQYENKVYAYHVELSADSKPTE